MIDIKHQCSTTVARHFVSHQDTVDLRLTVHMLRYIRTLIDIPKSNSLRNKRKLVWIHKLNIEIPNGLNIMDCGTGFKRS